MRAAGRGPAIGRLGCVMRGCYRRLKMRSSVVARLTAPASTPSLVSRKPTGTAIFGPRVLCGSGRGTAEGRQTVVYAVSVMHARNLADVFNDAGISAGVLVSDTPDRARAELIHRFRQGDLNALINVAVATEGFDLPDAACILLTRPTMSLALYLQMTGRGLRPKPDSGDCVVLDMAGNSLRHGLPEKDKKWSLQGARRTVARGCSFDPVREVRTPVPCLQPPVRPVRPVRRAVWGVLRPLRRLASLEEMEQEGHVRPRPRTGLRPVPLRCSRLGQSASNRRVGGVGGDDGRR